MQLLITGAIKGQTKMLTCYLFFRQNARAWQVRDRYLLRHMPMDIPTVKMLFTYFYKYFKSKSK